MTGTPLVAGPKGPDVAQEKESAPKDIVETHLNNQNTVLCDKDKDLAEAMKLCDISDGNRLNLRISEELRKKSTQELQSLLQNFQIYQQKMYEQSNYWLDAKEQLIMDAETHNKVIASLVQHARDQQEVPKGKIVAAKATTNAVKRK